MKLYKITASWCMSCIYMNNIFDEVINENNINFEIEPLDYDMDEKVKELNVGNILPVYILFDDKEIARSTGEKTKRELYNFFFENGGIKQ